MNKIYYTYEQWKLDKHKIVKHLSQFKNVHLVALYRGSLGMGMEFSNILDLPLSIGKFQSYDGDDKQFQLFYDAGITETQTIVILDDILDTGNTLKHAYKYFHDIYPLADIRSITVFGKQYPDDVFLKHNHSIHPHEGTWIAFPHEVLQ